MEFEEPLMVNPNITLYFEYATNMSWTKPIVIEVENIDLSSIRVIYDYNYLLKPEYYEWHSSLYGFDISYESIAYSFKDESEYKVIQYYFEGFTVYTNVAEYTHTFDIGDLSFEEDFVNLSLYQVIGITPTLDYEILTDNSDYTITFNKTSKEVKITDLNSGDGLLDKFDQINAVLNYSCAPISSYTEVYFKNEFNQTYLSDPEDTFYTYADIDYQYTTTAGVLFAENSAIITSDSTSFTAIDYCRNTDMSTTNELIGYGSELYDNFEIYYDDSSILYVADVDMDGEPDYKLTIDVDGNGELDIIKYGIDDPQGSGEIYWHTVIQDFENYQISVDNTLEEEQKTQWFDIDDRIFAHFDFNIGTLLLYALCLPILPFYITQMILPDVDYWAQKSTQNEVRKEQHVYVSYYSIKVDNDRDGLPDTQVDYESADIDIYYDVIEYRETILAAKSQNIYTILGEYVARSISSLFDGPRNDIVFNKFLTQDHLESANFSTCHWYVQANAPVLTATYRKFTENITTSYIDSYSQSTLTIIDYDDEGEIEETRTYEDDFDNGELGVDEFFSDLVEEHSITNVDSGQESQISFDPDLPFTHFENLTWDTQTWGPDKVPVKYDSLYVEGEGYNYTSNTFEQTIILRIPNRYSLYEDYGISSRYRRTDNGWAEFRATGILIRPLDGQVYYTSDAEAFAEGTAKTSGFYFYYDSDQNGFYETVYILSDVYRRPDASGLMQFNVMSIGYNYDGYHDLVPYERLGEVTNSETNIDSLGHESTKFGTNWVYNYNKLGNCKMLWERKSDLEELGLRVNDHIFEVYKLADRSDQNSKFSSLFYEIRHETYSNAWQEYRKQLAGDIIEQVFMSVTAGLLSAYVDTVLTVCSWGFGKAHATFFAHLTYFIVYTLMTKLSIDFKLQASQAKDRSQAFQPVSQENYEPTSLNSKALGDRYLQDSMAAALIGHPGGYYTTVSGGDSSGSYTAQALVSPPSIYRLKNAFGGFGILLAQNLWSMGESDPDVFTALDFDDRNLDILLHASELPSYNQRQYYTYENTRESNNLYNLYKFTTLGYLESRIREVSDYQLTTIRPTCVDGHPAYEFVNAEQYGTVLPQQTLFRPIVLSERSYSKLAPRRGHLIVTAQCKDYGNTKGVDPYELIPIEVLAGYEAKIPLMNNSFFYPIISVVIDVVKETDSETEYFAKSLIIDQSYYTLDSGNLYFTKSLESIISEKVPNFEEVLSQTWITELFTCEIYYDVHIYFKVFTPDTTEETHQLALSQATFYSIMDYFNQFTYAQVTANMISEIAYTETLSFWSTLISAPLVLLGSWTIKGTDEMIKQAGMKVVEGTLKSQVVKLLVVKSVISCLLAPLQEVLEEIILDGFTEALIENMVDIWGLSDEIGFWLSSLATSGREVGGALGRLALGAKTDTKLTLKSMFSLIKAKITGDTELKNKVLTDLQLKQQQDAQKHAELNTWQKLFKGGFLKGFLMLTSSLFLGSFSFMALRGFSTMVESTTEVAPKAYIEHKIRQQVREHNEARAELNEMYKDDKSMSPEKIFLENLRVPAGVDQEVYDDQYRDLQQDSDDDTKTDLDDAPIVDASRLFDPNPRIDTLMSQLRLTNKFQDIQLRNWVSELSQDSRFESKKAKLNQIIENKDKVSFLENVESIRKVVRGALEDFPTQLRYMDYTGIVLYDPKHIGFGFRLGPNANPKVTGNMQFREDFVETLTTTEYAQELQKAYDTKKPLNVYLYKQGEFILMPQSAQSHSEWLSQQGHNIKSDKIVLLPKDGSSSLINRYLPIYSEGKWDTSQTSPYFAELKIFFEKLESILKSSKLIKSRSEINGILKLDFGSGIDSEIYELSRYNQDGTLSSNEVYWNKREDTLNRWQVRISNFIEKSIITPNRRKELLNLINKAFNEYHRISGYAYRHPLYRSAKLTLFKAGEVLVDSGVLEYNFIEHIYKLLKSFNRPTPKSLYDKFFSNPRVKTRDSTVEKIRDNIIYAAENTPDTKFSLIHMEKIKEIFAEYLEELHDFKASETNLEAYKNTERRQLIQTLLDENKALRKLFARSVLDFQKLILNKDEDHRVFSFLRQENRPYHDTLFSMIYNSYGWSVKTFQKYGISVSYDDIKQMRTNIKKNVFDWILNTNYKSPLVNKKLLRKSNDKIFAPELDLVFALYVAAREKTNNPKLDFNGIQKSKLYRQSSLLNNLVKGERFTAKTIKGFQRTIKDWMNQESGQKTSLRKAIAYGHALSKLSMYARLRRLNLRGDTYSKQRGIFNSRQAKVYNIILGLGRQLGFDPGFFTPIDDQEFDMNKGARQLFKSLGKKIYMVIRHHFRNNPDRSSIALADQVIIDTRTHTNWESNFNEDEALVAIQVFETLTKYNRPVKESDIQNEFAKHGDKYSWIMFNWLNSYDFEENLRLFNKRKEQITTMPIDKFLKNNFPKAYEKFFNTMLKTHRAMVLEIIQAMHPNVDVSEIVNLGTNSDHIGPFSTVFDEILRMYRN